METTECILSSLCMWSTLINVEKKGTVLTMGHFIIFLCPLRAAVCITSICLISASEKFA